MNQDGLWKWENNQLVHEVTITLDGASYAAYDSTGSKFSMYNRNSLGINHLGIFRWSPGQKPQTLWKLQRQGMIFSVCFFDSDKIALGNFHGDFFVYNWQQKSLLYKRYFGQPIQKIAYDPQRKMFWLITRNQVFIKSCKKTLKSLA